MKEPNPIARTIWEVGVLVRGDTSGGRASLARTTELHTNLEGVGESRLIRAAVEAANAGGATDAADTPFTSPGLNEIEWPDRLVWIAGVEQSAVEAAFPSDHLVVRPLGISHNPPPGTKAARARLDELWRTHGIAACDHALARTVRRSMLGSLVAAIAFLLFLGAMIFIVRDLMRGAEREREYQEQADLYSVPDEAIEPTPTP